MKRPARLAATVIVLALLSLGSASADNGRRPHTAAAVGSGFASYVMLEDFGIGLEPGTTYEAVWAFQADGETYPYASSQQQTVDDSGVVRFVMSEGFLNREHESGTVTTWIEVPTPCYCGDPIETASGPAFATFTIP